MRAFFQIVRGFGSAVRAAAAVEAGYAPVRSDLERLGIDPAAFAHIARR